VTAFRIIDIEPQADGRWDAFVANHPDALVFHHSAWVAALEEAYGYRPRHLACEVDGGELAGILPLVLKRGIITGRTLASLPHSPVAGPLVLGPTAAASLVEGAIERMQVERRAHLQLRTAGRELDGIAPELAGRPGVLTYVVRLPDASEDLRFGHSRNHGAIKRAVQKATKAGVEVRPAETSRDLAEWYGLYVDTTRAHGAVPHSRRFFDVIWELLEPHEFVELLLAAGRLRLRAPEERFTPCPSRRGDLEAPAHPGDRAVGRLAAPIPVALVVPDGGGYVGRSSEEASDRMALSLSSPRSPTFAMLVTAGSGSRSVRIACEVPRLGSRPASAETQSPRASLLMSAWTSFSHERKRAPTLYAPTIGVRPRRRSTQIAGKFKPAAIARASDPYIRGFRSIT